MAPNSTYTVKVADAICERLASGESLRSICAGDGMPSRQTVDNWMAEFPEFLAKCARAREESAEFHHDKMQEIEDSVIAGTLEPHAASVVLSNKRWRMEKLKPRVYGAKVELSSDPERPVVPAVIQIVGVEPRGSGS